jgi:hypothetical protein
MTNLLHELRKAKYSIAHTPHVDHISKDESDATTT